MPDLSVVTDQASNWATVIATVISMVSLWLAIRVNNDSKKPQVVVSLEYDNDKNAMFLLVQNIGNGAAYNLSFSDYDESIFMSDLRSQVLKSFVTKGIPVLVPGAKRTTVVAAGQIMTELGDKSSDIHVAHKELGYFGRKRRVEEVFTLDYTSFAGSLYTQSDTHLIRRALDKIENDVKELIKVVDELETQ